MSLLHPLACFLLDSNSHVAVFQQRGPTAEEMLSSSLLTAPSGKNLQLTYLVAWVCRGNKVLGLVRRSLHSSVSDLAA